MGFVYSAKKPKSFDPVAFLAGYFDTIEINSTFYQRPPPTSAKTWAERVSANPASACPQSSGVVFRHERNAIAKTNRSSTVQL